MPNRTHVNDDAAAARGLDHLRVGQPLAVSGAVAEDEKKPARAFVPWSGHRQIHRVTQRSAAAAEATSARAAKHVERGGHRHLRVRSART